MLGKGLDEIYHEVAYIIACHKIWFANSFYNPEKKEEYKNKELEKLILESTYHVTISKDPVLFLLLLVDSIEPIKHSMQKTLDIELNEHLVIRTLKHDIKFDEKLQSLAEWLCPVEIKRNINSVEYSIHFKN